MTNAAAVLTDEELNDFISAANASTAMRMPSREYMKRLAATITAVKANQRTPGTVEVCAKCKASSPEFMIQEFRQPTRFEQCQEPKCPLRKPTP